MQLKKHLSAMLAVVIVFSLCTTAPGEHLVAVEEWVARYDGPGNEWDSTAAIAVDNSGNIYVTGTSGGDSTEWDYATIKYDPNGEEVWVARYNGPGNYADEARDIAVDDSNNVYVTGYSYGDGTDSDYTTIKYDPDGDELWVARYNGP